MYKVTRGQFAASVWHSNILQAGTHEEWRTAWDRLYAHLAQDRGRFHVCYKMETSVLDLCKSIPGLVDHLGNYIPEYRVTAVGIEGDTDEMVCYILLDNLELGWDEDAWDYGWDIDDIIKSTEADLLRALLHFFAGEKTHQVDLDKVLGNVLGIKGEQS